MAEREAKQREAERRKTEAQAQEAELHGQQAAGKVQPIDWCKLRLAEPAIAVGSFKIVNHGQWCGMDVAVLRLRSGDISTEAAVPLTLLSKKKSRGTQGISISLTRCLVPLTLLSKKRAVAHREYQLA